MGRLFTAGLLSVGLSLSVGCVVRAPVVPPIASLYTNIEAPLDIDVQGTPTETRRGESSTTTILGLFSFGDASIHAAAVAGDLDTIESADYNYFHVLGVYQKYTTVVYGK